MATNDNVTVTIGNNNPVLTKDDLAKVVREYRSTHNPYWSYDIQNQVYQSLFKGEFPKGEPAKEPEEWIWVTGYKGTDRNMRCKNDYQFEIGKKFDMAEDSYISVCRSGFHFCLKLEDVFQYYSIYGGRRFFEVSALVRKADYDKLVNKIDRYGFFSTDKLAAKSIIFTRELSIDEVLTAKGVDYSDWTTEEKFKAMEEGVDSVINARRACKLVELGYSEAFAKWIIDRGDFDEAYAVGQQKDLSMDMKVACILG